MSVHDCLRWYFGIEFKIFDILSVEFSIFFELNSAITRLIIGELIKFLNFC